VNKIDLFEMFLSVNSIFTLILILVL